MLKLISYAYDRSIRLRLAIGQDWRRVGLDVGPGVGNDAHGMGANPGRSGSAPRPAWEGLDPIGGSHYRVVYLPQPRAGG